MLWLSVRCHIRYGSLCKCSGGLSPDVTKVPRRVPKSYDEWGRKLRCCNLHDNEALFQWLPMEHETSWRGSPAPVLQLHTTPNLVMDSINNFNWTVMAFALTLTIHCRVPGALEMLDNRERSSCSNSLPPEAGARIVLRSRSLSARRVRNHPDDTCRLHRLEGSVPEL